MKPFMDHNFLLHTETAKKLYHQFASSLPILDYHCHINPEEIALDHRFENITQVWLGSDHYKWRLMRSNGVEEDYITGKAPDRDKFQKYAQTLEKAIGNPLFHWSHLELQRFFDFQGILNGKTADTVWNICNKKLQHDEMSVRSLIKRSHVSLLCTTDDPSDDLRYHQKIKEDPSFDVQVLPTWRPDRAMNLERPDYLDYLKKLSSISSVEIKTFKNLKHALSRRMEDFHSMGCKICDYGMDYVMYYPASEEEVECIFSRRLSGEHLTNADILKFKTAFMIFSAQEYKKYNWVMQLHFGCRRNNNNAMFQELGPDTGFDCISDFTPISQLANFLDALSMKKTLPKTILYSLNPSDDEQIAALAGCFQDNEAVGKIQQGSAWWFNDNKTGMIRQMTSLANLGLLGNFIGMLTDSRSFLSYSRHEYFRRILCSLIGDWVENGEYPNDMENLETIIKDISYNNAVHYFGFDLDTV